MLGSHVGLFQMVQNSLQCSKMSKKIIIETSLKRQFSRDYTKILVIFMFFCLFFFLKDLVESWSPTPNFLVWAPDSSVEENILVQVGAFLTTTLSPQTEDSQRDSCTRRIFIYFFSPPLRSQQKEAAAANERKKKARLCGSEMAWRREALVDQKPAGGREDGGVDESSWAERRKAGASLCTGSRQRSRGGQMDGDGSFPGFCCFSMQVVLEAGIVSAW